MKWCGLYKTLVFILIFATCFNTSAKSRRLVAEVAKTRGKVTQLAPGEKIARSIKVNEKVREDTSIVTHDKSFIKLVFEDGSTLNIGPNSKAVVTKMSKEGNGIINLLKGQTRYHIKQNDEGNKKFFVRTRNTAVGVRGTEFETIYNPENKITSLLTYTGEVAMVKTSDSQDTSKTDLKKAKRIVRNFDNKIILEEEPALKEINEKELESLLKENPVLIKRGQFSQTVQKIDSVSQPVKISPVQLNALYANNEFVETDRSKAKPAELDSSKAKITLIPVDQNAPAEGIYDPEKKIYAAKSGGFFDRKTGLYVAPSADALFDQKNKVYYAQNDGAIDIETGTYVPPVGIELDAKDGFVAQKIKDSAPAEFVAAVLENKNRLNKSLSQDVVIGKGASETMEGSFRALSNRELISKNIFSLNLEPYSQKINQNSDTYLGSNRAYESEESKDLTLALDYASGSKWQPTTSFTFRSLTIPQSQRGASISQTGSDLTSLLVGVKYSLSPRWNTVLITALDQQYFLHHVLGTTVSTSFIRVTIPKFKAGFEGTLLRSGRFFINTGLLLGTNLAQTTGDHKLNGLGFNMDYSIKLKYWLSKKYILSFGFKGAYESYSVGGTSQVYQADVTRNSNGLHLGLATYF
ncbi:MAG: FecR domain-containing protein [Bacteriovoracaceae bacterium]|nr:FecR domain-containing protein [Bacteriovoracaceae bacterium]